uniref:RNA-directed DNA polymerase, eukaryota, reverse transcriptase zinc-binding domain protein n=1 Tax=Tanacetum cinerariifolium TaxID=118510 RepID=A0A699KSX3_TANCI|nr:RNA-directed DNA polymerase, eukaryota, reverse transcriptase zinc-binding domain protein [Tanacetum cinerariifolium]
MINGVWVENLEKVKREFYEHFSKRFCCPDPSYVRLQMSFPNTLSMDQQRDIECEVSNAEIKKAVWDCGMDKAPGPDDFSFGFYRRFWYLVEKDVCDAVSDIVSEVQSAFIAKRQILDGPFILNEVLHWCKVKKKQALIFKACLKTLRGFIFINGSPTKEFQFGKGLKQRDPLAPFLFILIMESLHLSFYRVVEAGMFQGLQLGGDVTLSCMFYADDAVFVGQWSEGNINSLVHVLDCFKLASGLKINMKKSKIMGMHVKSDKVNTAATKLRCLILKVPFTYLGVLNVLELIRSHFFNGHDYNSKKASWVKWKSVLTSKERGGLGVSSLYALNRGLLFKPGKRSCWLNIIHEVKILSDKGIDLMKSMSIKLGDGVNTKFWEDGWSVGGKLKYKFPRLYALEECKCISVALKLGQLNLAGSFRRTPRGGVEQHQFVEMSELVKSISLVPRSDRLRWDLDSSGDFTVASVAAQI